MELSIVSRDERLSIIESLLFHSPEGVRVVELAETCQVDRRTIYRDIAKLRANGVPIYQKRGRFFVSREYYLASVHLNIHEMMVLFTAVRVLSQLAEAQNPHTISALAKLGAALPEAMRVHVHKLVEMLRQTPVDRLHMTVMEKLTRAWSEQRWARLWHSSQPNPLEFATYFLEANAQGHLYVVGADAQTGFVRTLSLRGVLRVELLKEQFMTDSGLDAMRYLFNAFGILEDETAIKSQVSLRFLADALPLWLHKVHSDDVRLETLNSGETLLHVWVQDWQVLLPWLRELGARVEVLSPTEFREWMQAEAHALCQLYEKSS